eukprot:scaffold226_cov167-Pinguiococcus_pyrenoidosus.AAC.8
MLRLGNAAGHDRDGKLEYRSSSLLERIASREIFPRSLSLLLCTRVAVPPKADDALQSARECHRAPMRGPEDAGGAHERRRPAARVAASRAPGSTGTMRTSPVASRLSSKASSCSSIHKTTAGRCCPTRAIKIELRAPNVPTIDLVDIPGIVQYPPAAAKATREIATRYTCEWSTPSCSASCRRGPRACVIMPFGRCCGRRWRAIA